MVSDVLGIGRWIHISVGIRDRVSESVNPLSMMEIRVNQAL